MENFNVLQFSEIVLTTSSGIPFGMIPVISSVISTLELFNDFKIYLANEVN